MQGDGADRLLATSTTRIARADLKDDWMNMIGCEVMNHLNYVPSCEDGKPKGSSKKVINS